MGEERNEEGNKEQKIKEEAVKEDKKEEEKKKDEEPQEIILKVDMHCEACARKVTRSLKGFQGVEDVMANCKASKVVVKGNAVDPSKVCQRIQKKTGRKVELISPLPKPPEESKKEEAKPEPKEEKKAEPPPVINVVLKVRMHCEACAQALQKRIGKIRGVESVTTDIANDQVTVKGVLDPDKLVNDVYKKTGKQASVVKDEEMKDEEKKEEEEKEDEKKDEKQDDKKQVEERKKEDDKKTDIKKNEYWPPKYNLEYAYAPQMFSDENPNACSVM